MKISDLLNEQKQGEVEELFNDWNGLKQDLHFDKDLKEIPFYHEREIYWVYLGQNIGTEIYGKGKDHMRPVLVLKKFRNSFLGVPLTSSEKPIDNPFFYLLGEFGLERKKSWACLAQIRFF